MIGRLAVIIGHTLTRKGAAAVAPLQTSEYDYNEKIAALLVEDCRFQRIEMKVFRHIVSYADTYAEVNDWVRSDGCAIELHFNAEASGKARGTETLYDDSPELAKIIQGVVVLCFERTAEQNRRAKLLSENDRGHYNLTQLKVPAVIVEPFFGSNPEDAKLGLEKQEDYANALAVGARLFLSNKLYEKHSRLQGTTHPTLVE